MKKNKRTIYKNDDINKKYWANVEPEKMLSGLSFPGSELLSYLTLNDKILDVGCGVGKVSEYLTEKGYIVTGIDLNEKAIKQAQERNKKIKYKIVDVTETLPFENDSFDAIVVSFLFVSLIMKENQEVVAKEMTRVLKKGGYIWICEATYSPDYEERYKLGKKVFGEDLIAFSFDADNQVKRIIRHYREEDLDILFASLIKIESSKIVVQSPSSGMDVKSLKVVYKK